MEGQTTKKYNLPLSHLDYKYIESCNNPKEIEKIVNVLRYSISMPLIYHVELNILSGRKFVFVVL